MVLEMKTKRMPTWPNKMNFFFLYFHIIPDPFRRWLHSVHRFDLTYPGNTELSRKRLSLRFRSTEFVEYDFIYSLVCISDLCLLISISVWTYSPESVSRAFTDIHASKITQTIDRRVVFKHTFEFRATRSRERSEFTNVIVSFGR